MKKIIVVSFLIIQTFVLSAFVTVRVKDISNIRGIRANQLVGYGLVTGLSGQGDSSRSALTKTTLAALLKNLGINVDKDGLQSQNTAVVMVTAELKPFVRVGDRIDVTVSSIGDAKSLRGGVLLQTPLKAANKKTFVVVQGKVLVGGSKDTTLNVGHIPQGGIVESKVNATYIKNNQIKIALHKSDFTTILNLKKAIQKKYKKVRLSIEDPSTLAVTIPSAFTNSPVEFISAIGLLEIQSDSAAKVVVDGKSGMVVMGENVKISRVAVSYNGIKISVGFGTEKSGNSFMIENGSSIKSLVNGLNRIGAKAEDIINILQALDKAGALKAQLVIM